jgi:hypothetical protein
MRQQHKHYYCIRAFGDGWKIETDYGDEIWVPADNPRFSASCKYRVVPDEDGWLPWYGGECPVAAGTMVDVRYRRVLGAGKGGVPTGLVELPHRVQLLAAEEKAVYAHLSRWEHLPCDDDIVAYRIVEEAKVDPYAELRAAAKDPNKEIAIRGHEVTLGWHSGKYWKFDRPVEDYVVRDKPKKIKLLAWVEANGNLNWRKEGYEYGPCWTLIWKRIPSEDKEIEVEEWVDTGL